MKYVILLCDGMADYPLENLAGKTPMEKAHKPLIDALAAKSVVGMVQTVPKNMQPGSDVANLSIMGYDPFVYYTGRSPLEAESLGISLKSDDVTFRCNLVTLSSEDDYSKKTMVDYCSDEISSEEAAVLIDALNQNLKSDLIEFYSGISYRHIMVYSKGLLGADLTPPHDISLKTIGEYLPKGSGSDFILSIMKKSFEILKNHPVNIKRAEKNLHPANSAWLWGEGKKPSLTAFSELFGIKGSVVSAVDLVKGIGKAAKMEVVNVERATGNINTNYEGKAKAAFEALKNDSDLVYLHFEGPDECGHRGEIENKYKSIEYIDKRALTPLFENLKTLSEPFGILILPDHPTPLSIRTHTGEKVPFLAYYSDTSVSSAVSTFSELSAAKTGINIDIGHDLIRKFINKDLLEV